MEQPEPPEVCAVCREPMEGEGVVTLDPCGHRLHADCAVRWFRMPSAAGACPICRDASELEDVPFLSLRERLTLVRRAARRRDAPAPLRRMVARLRATEQGERDAARALREALGEEAVRAVTRRIAALRRRRWSSYRQVRRQRRTVALYDHPSLPVVGPGMLVGDVRASWR